MKQLTAYRAINIVKHWQTENLLQKASNPPKTNIIPSWAVVNTTSKPYQTTCLVYFNDMFCCTCGYMGVLSKCFALFKIIILLSLYYFLLVFSNVWFLLVNPNFSALFELMFNYEVY